MHLVHAQYMLALGEGGVETPWVLQKFWFVDLQPQLYPTKSYYEICNFIGKRQLGQKTLTKAPQRGDDEQKVESHCSAVKGM